MYTSPPVSFVPSGLIIALHLAALATVCMYVCIYLHTYIHNNYIYICLYAYLSPCILCSLRPYFRVAPRCPRRGLDCFWRPHRHAASLGRPRGLSLHRHAGASPQPHTLTHTYIYVFIYISYFIYIHISLSIYIYHIYILSRPTASHSSSQPRRCLSPGVRVRVRDTCTHTFTHIT